MNELNQVRFECFSKALENPVSRVFVNGVEVMNVRNATVETKGKGVQLVTLEFLAQVEAVSVEHTVNEHLLNELDLWAEITCVGDSNRRFMHLATGAIREEPPEVVSVKAKRGRPKGSVNDGKK